MYYCMCVCRLQIVNLGGVKLEFSWQVLSDASSNMVNSGQRGSKEQY